VGIEKQNTLSQQVDQNDQPYHLTPVEQLTVGIAHRYRYTHPNIDKGVSTMSDPELARHYAVLGKEATQEGDYARAEHYLMLSIEEDSRCTWAYANLAALYGILGKTQESLQASWQALEYDPHNAVLLFNFGTGLMQTQDYQQAAAYLKKAALQDPKYSLAAFNLAMCYDRMEQLDDALLWYQRAAELDPSDPDPIYNMAEVCVRKKDFVQGERLCREALNLFDAQFRNTQFAPFLPDGEPLSREQLLADIAHKNAAAHSSMAFIQVNQGKLQPALGSISRAIEIYPHRANWFLLT
jgi:Tfp pilus assembly protein PilF